jgi:hypothetical protein
MKASADHLVLTPSERDRSAHPPSSPWRSSYARATAIPVVQIDGLSRTVFEQGIGIRPLAVREADA